MITDWKTEIVKAVLVRQELERVDNLYAYPLPQVAASDERIAVTEAVVGALDRRYREFLTHADGWQGFLQAIDLFGTAQLLGASPMDEAKEGITAIGEDTFSTYTGFEIDQVTLIGASCEQTDLWLLGRPGTGKAGQVLWFWGSDFETYPDFDEFFLAMGDYNRLALQRRQQGR